MSAENLSLPCRSEGQADRMRQPYSLALTDAFLRCLTVELQLDQAIPKLLNGWEDNPVHEIHEHSIIRLDTFGLGLPLCDGLSITLILAFNHRCEPTFDFVPI